LAINDFDKYYSFTGQTVNFNTYILDFRIYFYVEQLKTNKTYRKHSIKSLSFALSFNHAESFSTHLLKKSGISPSYFVKEIEK
jgi:AraC-like DNA-binding protein